MTNELISQSIAKEELQLNLWDKILYYANSPSIAVGASAYAIFSFVKKESAETSGSPDYVALLFIVLVSAALVGFFFRQQKRKLQLEPVYVRHTREELAEILQKLAEEEKWTIISMGDKHLVASTHRKRFSFYTGERVTILFDPSKIWVNCIEEHSFHEGQLVSKKRLIRQVEKVKEAVSAWKNS